MDDVVQVYNAKLDCSQQANSAPPPLSAWIESSPKLGEAMQECNFRFVITLPEETMRNAPRLCFEMQEAFWFYLDYLQEHSRRDLPKLSQTVFFHLMLEASDVLQSIYPTASDRSHAIQSWRDHCKSVPIRGAILLNMQFDKCLMVQPWNGNKWMFPRGKMDEGETDVRCAAREVLEETGIDIAKMVDSELYVEADLFGTGHMCKLFVVTGLDEEVPCAPNKRKEISKIGWIPLAKLPGWDPHSDETALRFFCVEPFVADLRWWVEGLSRKGWLERRRAADRILTAATPERSAASRHLAKAIGMKQPSVFWQRYGAAPDRPPAPPPPPPPPSKGGGKGKAHQQLEASATLEQPPGRWRAGQLCSAMNGSSSHGGQGSLERRDEQQVLKVLRAPPGLSLPSTEAEEFIVSAAKPAPETSAVQAHTVFASLIALDMVKVMRQFDDGWESPARQRRAHELKQ